MTRWFILVFFAIITSNYLYAQQNNLEIKGSGANFFVEHKVAPKESFYSLGRMYNVAPKLLASYNKLNLETGLNVGQDIKIPLDKNNFIQSESVARGEALIPVYHTVQPKETLFRLGVNYNKVPLASLKKWNHLQADAVKEGTPMIVGFLKVDKSQSPLASSTPAIENQVAAKKEEKPVEKKTDIPAEPKAVVKIVEPAKTDKDVAIAEKEQPKVTEPAANPKSSIDFSGGYFKTLYGQQTDNKSPFYETGSAGVFKSTSGWQDGKYYCFSNGAAPGTIVKITSNSTGKIVYAKVLDAIPDIRQNAGLILILSNSAAEELGADQSRFDCVLSYVKEGK